jgi:Skp family chaperone for outer membrane proteins
MKTRLLALALFALTAGLVLALPGLSSDLRPDPRPDPRPAVVPPLPTDQAAGRPKIEAVFVLDTTGSMGGLIQAAKENIWSIASTMAQAQPTPELSIGLVAFRDRGDAYVTRVIPLSTDLDGMYAQLMDLQAGGGGDHPEAVNRALHDAIHGSGWSQDGDAYRTIFLIGDAPPKVYDDEPSQAEILRQAAARGIVVNTIQAGEHADTRVSWQQIAAAGQGAYFSVTQAGSALAVSTPYDEKIARLARDLDGTRLFYGDASRQRAMQAKTAAADKLHTTASPAAQARRAAFNRSEAGRDNLLGNDELVDAVASGRVDIADVPAEHLPAPMAAMSVDQRAQAVRETLARRSELAAEIDALSEQRQAHIAAELATSSDKEASLDYRLFDTVKAQAAGKGLRYEAPAPMH